VDTNGSKQAAALEFGATDFVDASAIEDPVKAVRDRGLTRGVDHTFECVGHPALIRHAIDLLDWGGTCTLVGVPKLGAEASFVVNSLYKQQVDSRLSIRGVETPPRHSSHRPAVPRRTLQARRDGDAHLPALGDRRCGRRLARRQAQPRRLRDRLTTPVLLVTLISNATEGAGTAVAEASAVVVRLDEGEHLGGGWQAS